MFPIHLSLMMEKTLLFKKKNLSFSLTVSEEDCGGMSSGMELLKVCIREEVILVSG